MDQISFTPKPDQFTYTFGGNRAVSVVKPGSILTLWSEDAFLGNLFKAEHKWTDRVRPGYVNPQTGPFYVEGAEPGDTLALHFVSIEPSRDWGVSTLSPLFGGLTSTDSTASLQAPLEQRTWIYQLDRAARTLRFEPRGGGRNIELPIDPMLGTVAVAPAFSEVRSSLVPGPFGGNMDLPALRAGATLFLGVNVDGALFSIGDGHLRQGEGEACGTAVEGAVTTTLIVGLIRGKSTPFPRLEDDSQWASIGSARPLEDAWRIAQLDLVRWFEDLLQMDAMDTYQFLSQATKARVGNIVNPNYSMMVSVGKAALPNVYAYEGAHNELRRQAASLKTA
jgi:acetamidase/formamidase